MDVGELIDAAKRGKGTLGAVAEGLGIHQNRLSEWRKGSRKPDAHEIAYLATCAGLPVLETVAEIEAQLDSRYAPIWQSALGKLRAAGVAATVTLTLLISSMMSPADVQAAQGSQLENVRFRQLLQLARRLFMMLRNRRIDRVAC